MNELKLLNRMREVIVSGWTQQAAARNSDGKECHPLVKDAVCWCLAGALIVADRDCPGSDIPPLSLILGVDNYIIWNDAHDRTKDDVVKALDKAIAIYKVEVKNN